MGRGPVRRPGAGAPKGRCLMFGRPNAAFALLALMALSASALAIDEPATRWRVNLSASDSCIAFSQDGSMVAIGSGTIVDVRRSIDGVLIRRFDIQAPAVRAAAFSPDGTILVTGGATQANSDRSVKVWRMTDGLLLNSWRDYVTPYWLGVMPDGRTLLVGGTDYRETGRGITLYDMASGGRLREYAGAYAQSFDMNPSVTLVAAGYGASISVYNVADTTRAAHLPCSSASVVCLPAFSPDGAHLAVASDARELRLFRTSDWQILYARALGRNNRSYGLSYSPDSSTLALGTGYGASILFLRAFDGEPLQEFTPAGATGVNKVAFSPDNGHFAYTLFSPPTFIMARNPYGSQPPPMPSQISLPNVTAKPGQTVPIAATLSNGINSLPGRELAFAVDGTGIGIAVTEADGTAALPYHTLIEAPGGHLMTATYAGDADFADTTGYGVLIVGKAGTALFAPDRAAPVTTSVTLKAYLRRTTDNGPVSGRSIKFSVAGVAVGSAATSASGEAVLPWTVDDGPATRTLRTEFAGDTSYLACTADATLTAQTLATKVYVVDRTQMIKQYTVLKAYLYLLNNSAVPGKPMTVKVDGTALGTLNTNASGYVQFGYTVPEGTGAGVRTVRGEFAGDAGYLASGNNGKLTVTQGNLYIWPYIRSAKVGTNHTLKAYVRSLPDYVIQPGKPITFSVNGTPVGTANVAADGWASAIWAIPAGEPTGSHTGSAAFAGDSWYAAVTANTAFNVVP